MKHAVTAYLILVLATFLVLSILNPPPESVFAVCVFMLLLSLAVAAVKGYTLGRTLRIIWWGLLHPFQKPPDDI